MILLAIILLLYIVSFFVYKSVIAKKNRKKYGISKIVKNTYKKIEVPINKINILTREYYEDKVDGLIEVQSVNALFNNRNIETTLKYISVITYDNFLYNGKKYSFKSIPIDLSDAEIKEIFEKQKSINLYFDEKDLSKHFFDLGILAKNL